MVKLTLESLMDVVRNAENLEEVKRYLGPSEQEREMSKRRLSNIEALWTKADENNWGNDPDVWPYPNNETYAALLNEQRYYENLYC